jgi:hypothetical protein
VVNVFEKTDEVLHEFQLNYCGIFDQYEQWLRNLERYNLHYLVLS